MSISLDSRPVHLLVLIFSGIALYGFTLGYPFVFDSFIYIIGNPLITDSDPFFLYFDIEKYFDTYLNRLSHRDLLSSFLLRPIAYLSFHLNYLQGGLNPAGFRLVNIAIHISNALLLYHILSSVIIQRTNGTDSGQAFAVPFFASLLFLIHPLQSQSVTYIAQRFTSLVAFFYLATMLLYIQSRVAENASVRKWCYIGSIVTLIMGLLTKECAFTLPVTLLLVDGILLQRSLRDAVNRLVPHLVCIWLIPVQVLRIAHEMRAADILLPSATNIVGNIYTRSEYAITQIRAILSYLRLLILPYNLNFDPDYPLYRSLLHPEIILSILIWTAILGAGICLIRRRERTVSTDLAAFSIFWFPVAISVSSSFIPLEDLMFEHRSYLPSVAFFTGTVAYFSHAVAGRKEVCKRAALVSLWLMALTFGLLTIQRNKTYSSNISLWQDTVKKNPGKARPNLALGNAYLNDKQYEKALPYLEKSLELAPKYTEAHLSMGSAFQQMGMPQKAIEIYEAYLEKFPPDLTMQMNLSLAYAEMGWYPQAIDLLQQLETKNYATAGVLGLLSELNLRMGKHVNALSYLVRAMKADQEDPTVDLSDILEPLRKKILDQGGRNSAARP